MAETIEKVYRGCTIYYNDLREARSLPPFRTGCISTKWWWRVSEVEAAIDELLGPVEPLGEFRFDSWNPGALDYREIFIVGSAWPAVVRKVDVGEAVYAHYVVKNIGTESGEAKITVKDRDTGTVVKTWSLPELSPKARFKTSSPGALIGKMPARDWRLEFKVEP